MSRKNSQQPAGVKYRHAVITGASSGLGAALAEAMVSNVSRFTLVGRNRQRLSAVAETCRQAGVAVDEAICDVTDRIAMERCLSAADLAAPIDLVVANAGIGGKDVLAGDAGEPAELAARIMDINLNGAVNTVAPLLDAFVARGRGQVVLVGSAAGYVGLAEAPVYSASKAALHVYGEGLARRLFGTGVSVTVICPGFIATPMSASLPHKPLFAWPVERAARRVVRALERREREVVFPWQFRIARAAVRLLPRAVVDAGLRLGSKIAAGGE